MSSFTYSLPFSNEKFLEGIIFELKRSAEYETAHLLRGASVTISADGFSYYAGGRGRHNAYAAYVTFYLAPHNIDALDNEETKRLLREICDKLIPDDVGYDVKNVSFNIDLSKDFELEDDLIADLERQSDKVSGIILSKILPQDVKEKGYRMSEVYTYLYAVENSIRLFIEEVCKKQYGSDYFEKISIPSATQKTLDQRIADATSKKWLSVRGDSKLFYLDFKDLATIINNNWDIFKDYFPSQDFIIPKIKEMADCRNLIAHNSLIDETERNVIKTYYNVILKQISSVFN
ncbi:MULTISPECIES: Swt1 family HEPN domain-containing protein [unclassified Paenibacillus]|uniref:Swt1 family HEPN domain-containing protein n=1 Tax=unclassified Paenibacillus TaxID=185978 RepID=UPI002117F9D2|nr:MULTISPECIES: Swt1 family HEPN domain-containing protein [unclassified Paenibacillus]